MTCRRWQPWLAPSSLVDDAATIAYMVVARVAQCGRGAYQAHEGSRRPPPKKERR